MNIETKRQLFDDMEFRCNLYSGEYRWTSETIPDAKLIEQIDNLPDDPAEFMAMDLSGYPQAVVDYQAKLVNQVHIEELAKVGVTPATWMLSQVKEGGAPAELADKVAIAQATLAEKMPSIRLSLATTETLKAP